MKKTALLALCLALLATLLSGCTHAVEIDERAFVFVMTLDVENNGDLRIGIQIAAGTENLNESSARSGGAEQDSGAKEAEGEGKEGSTEVASKEHDPLAISHLQQGAYYLISAVGKEYYQALSMLYATVPRRLDFSHVREIIVSERLARSDAFRLLLDNLMATKTMRTAAHLLIVKDSALDMAAHQQSFLGSRLAEYIELRMRYAQYFGFVGHSSLQLLWERMLCDYGDTLATYGAVNDFKKTKPLVPDRILDELAGHLPRASINETEYMGAALFNDKKMVGTVTGFGMQMTRLLGKSEGVLVYAVDGTPFHLRAKKPPRLQMSLVEGKVHLKVEISLWAWQSDVEGGVSLERLREKLTEDCLAQIRFYQALRCDPLGFAEKIVRHFPTVDAWRAADWRAAFHDAEAEVTVQVERSNLL